MWSSTTTTGKREPMMISRLKRVVSGTNALVPTGTLAFKDPAAFVTAPPQSISFKGKFESRKGATY